MYALPRELARCYARAYTAESCERKLAGLAAIKTERWCKAGVVSTAMIDRVYAVSDVHGDAGLLLHWLVSAGLLVAEKGRYRWVNKRHALVICGDVADDSRGDAIPDAELERLGFEGFEGAPSGSGTWNALAFVSYLVARCGARIVVVIGNHELMNLAQDPAMDVGKYKRRVTEAQEAARGGWAAEGGMRALLGPLLVAVCAGNLLFMHAEPPLFGPEVMFGKVHRATCLAEFTSRLNARLRASVDDPVVLTAVWGRKLGSGVTEANCETYRAFFPDVTLVRGHCPNREGAAPSVNWRVFGARNVVENTIGADRAARVYFAKRPSEMSLGAGYHGVVVSCGGDAAETFGGSVFRIDCMGSLAFGLKERESSVVAFDTAGGGVHCIVATRRG